MSSFLTFYTKTLEILYASSEKQTLYTWIKIKNERGKNRKGQDDNPRAFKAMKGTQSKVHSQVIQIHSSMCPSYINKTENRVITTLSNLTHLRYAR